MTSASQTVNLSLPEPDMDNLLLLTGYVGSPTAEQVTATVDSRATGSFHVQLLAPPTFNADFQELLIRAP